MPNFELSQQPKYPIVTFDTDSPISMSMIKECLVKNNGITLCVRSKSGHENRGGYFFSINKLDDNLVKLESIEGEHIDTLSFEKIVRFINHATGLKFDKQMLVYCKNEINFRND